MKHPRPSPFVQTDGFIRPDQLYTATETAGILGVSPKTLQEWRRNGLGPTVTRLRPGSPPRYRGLHILQVMDEAADPTNTAA